MAVRVLVGVLDDVLGTIIADDSQDNFSYEGPHTENLRRMVSLAHLQLARRRGGVMPSPETIACALPGWVRGYTWARILEPARDYGQA